MTSYVFRHPVFPLVIDSSQRYLRNSRGEPFFLNGDTPWSLPQQCTREQITTYLADRQSKGFNAILFNAIEHQFTSQSPAYRNAYGADPFTTMTDFASTPVEAYWSIVDHIVDEALRRNIACLINPAYLGFGGGSEGWMSEITAEVAGDLQTYGTWLANRYRQPNVLWCFGGDYAGTTTERNKQWNVVTGIRSVRTTDIITAHNGRSDSDAYTHWNGYAGFNLNNVYISSDGSDGWSESATAMGRSMPFVMIECGYENDNANYYLGIMQSVFSGACGYFFGHTPLWNFRYASGGAAQSIANDLGSTGATRMSYLRDLMFSYRWHRFEPKTDTSLVTSALSTGTTRVCPMLSIDRTAAMVWVNDARTVTVNMAAFVKTMTARWWDWTTGGFTAIGSYGNSGTQDFTSAGARVLVLD